LSRVEIDRTTLRVSLDASAIHGLSEKLIVFNERSEPNK
jgi:hypothetical protein